MGRITALLIVFVLTLGLIPSSHFASAGSAKTIDGDLSDWSEDELIAESHNIYTSAFKGADLYRLYATWDDQYLYIAIETNNTENWKVVYGIGLDTDPGTGNGYTFADQDGDSSTPEDMWWKRVAFGNGYAIDYEIYFWYDTNNDKIGGGQFGKWDGSSWISDDVNNVITYAQTSGNGLKVLEMAIPWDAIGGKPEKIALIAWVIDEGYGGNSPVDSVPLDPAVGDNITDPNNPWDEKTDVDTFTNLAEISLTSGGQQPEYITVGNKTLDGKLDDWNESEIAAFDETGVGQEGANLSRLYVSYDDGYLYLALETNNTASWNVAYGFGIDIDPLTGNGYTNETDAWNRKIQFGGSYAVDYELYFWWDGASGKITASNLGSYSGNWEMNDLDDVGVKYWYTGNASTGLKVIEIAVPWSALGDKKPQNFAVSAWVAGKEGSSAVDVLPQESVANDSEDEWNDVDVITEMAEFGKSPLPDLKVSLTGPTVVGLNRTAVYNVTVENAGMEPAENFTLKVYVNETLYHNWTLSLDGGNKTWFTVEWKPEKIGTYTVTAVVDEENKITEPNEDNNVANLDVEVVWVGRVDVDGNPSDWPAPDIENNTYTIYKGFLIWKDPVGDHRKDKDPYLPGGTSSHADLTEVAVTKDDRYVYFMFRFADMSNIKIGDNGATFVAVPIDYKDGGADWVAGEIDTKTSILWDIQIAVNLKCNGDVGKSKAVENAGNSKTSMLYFVLPNGTIAQVEDAKVGVDLSLNTIEVAVPVEVFEGASEFSFTVATGLSYGEGVWNFGDPWNNDDISDAVDVLSEKPTKDEVLDGYLDYYITAKMNGILERAKSTNYEEIRDKEMKGTIWGGFVNLNKIYATTKFKEYYSRYLELREYLRNQTLQADTAEKLSQYDEEVSKLLTIYNDGKSKIEIPGVKFIGALKVHRAYSRMKRIVEDLEAIVEELQKVNYETMKRHEELSKKLTKAIDGNLDDWSVQPVAVDTEGYGQDGANLKALYVDYDDNFLYIALTTDNKASWRVVYGISMDYKDGGYTSGQDSWGKKLSFTRGIDAQLYFYWNGEFFGDPGTGTITSAQLVLWNGNGWDYKDLQWAGFYAYAGGMENGLQTLEIAIPWEELGGKPKEIHIVAYVTGQGIGDSAVDSLPLQNAVRDKQPGDEWGDEDTFTEFTSISII